ncbi:hypothetical protein SAMN05216289_1261 [Dokdonella immobilis]|uniref:Uncharacterized protein n=1 Tax=Dokdonella immobilis TaxID=578942 RepID=A0A1I4ZHD6_9GAMM|nr:hypothetical protein SAMN05216289_1261 [Dokdonella immobilis]
MRVQVPKADEGHWLWLWLWLWLLPLLFALARRMRANRAP